MIQITLKILTYTGIVFIALAYIWMGLIVLVALIMEFLGGFIRKENHED